MQTHDHLVHVNRAVYTPTHTQNLSNQQYTVSAGAALKKNKKPKTQIVSGSCCLIFAEAPQSCCSVPLYFTPELQNLPEYTAAGREMGRQPADKLPLNRCTRSPASCNGGQRLRCAAARGRGENACTAAVAVSCIQPHSASNTVLCHHHCHVPLPSLLFFSYLGLQTSGLTQCNKLNRSPGKGHFQPPLFTASSKSTGCSFLLSLTPHLAHIWKVMKTRRPAERLRGRGKHLAGGVRKCLGKHFLKSGAGE